MVKIVVVNNTPVDDIHHALLNELDATVVPQIGSMIQVNYPHEREFRARSFKVVKLQYAYTETEVTGVAELDEVWVYVDEVLS